MVGPTPYATTTFYPERIKGGWHLFHDIPPLPLRLFPRSAAVAALVRGLQ